MTGDLIIESPNTLTVAEIVEATAGGGTTFTANDGGDSVVFFPILWLLKNN